MNEKQAAGQKAIEEIHSGMTVGLGSGTTVYYFLEALGKQVARGLTVTGVATSDRTAKLAAKWRIPIKSLNDVERIDVTIDGADEFDAQLNGIKGGGGALLYEKMVALASNRRVWVVGSGKQVERLGAFPLPIEVVPFGWKHVQRAMEQRQYAPELRLTAEGEPFITDAGHYILDLHLGSIADPQKLAYELDQVTGIVEHGLFLNMTDRVLIGRSDGSVVTRDR
ncbi:MAG: ribose-5-phosphate isomerase RpiA [Sporolactobacillus sp.]|jgi:ribose 5-phosphate isomerase A|nr:ribose-5-phosphate isomerase RpiA [Sporolactobacillus sp.]